MVSLDVIGNVAYSLDSQYAEKMEQRLRKVKQNEVHTLDLIKNHTSILDQIIKILKENTKEIKNHLKESITNWTNLTSRKSHTQSTVSSIL